MATPIGERAIADAVACGKAILKFITPNNVGLTGGHECGFYLPKPVWRMYSPHAPEDGVNKEHAVRVLWPDGRQTDSRVKWYGRGTRSEYRLTRFGRDFPWLAADSVGDLLVLIPKTHTEFIAYILDLEDDIAEIQASLGVEIGDSWGVYVAGAARIENETECVERIFRQFADTVQLFPTGEVFSLQSRAALDHCCRSFGAMPPDDLLLRCMDAEYRLFKLVERQLCQQEIVRVFKSVDDFLRTAAAIMNRRKARAGRALENHFGYILGQAQIPHDVRPLVDGRPDVLIPGRGQYLDESYPVGKLFALGLKTTCKDRWRQVLNEAKRVPHKYILTLQPGISSRQLQEMKDAGVVLIVPRPLHGHYPPKSPMKLLGVADFLAAVRRELGAA